MRSDEDARRALLAIAAVALALRLLVVLQVRHGYLPLTDAADFDRWATSLAQEHRFPGAPPPFEGPTAFRTPAWPLLLAAAYVVVGTSHTVGLLLNAGLGTIAVLLLGALAWQVWDRRVALVVAGLAAAHPTMLLFGSGLQLEPLLMCSVLGSLACAFRYRSTPQRRWLLGAAVLFGIALLTREIAWPLAFVDAALILGAAPEGRPLTARARPVLLLWLVAGLVVLPWVIRNHQRFDRLVLLSTSPDVALAGTYNDASLAEPEAPWIVIGNPSIDGALAEDPDLGEAAVGDRLRGRTTEFLGEHPGYVAKAAFWNFVRLFDLNGSANAERMARQTPYPPRLNQWAVRASYLVEVLALAAIALGAHRRMPSIVWLLPIAAIGTTILVFGMIRYRASIEPFTLLLAGAGVVSAVDRHRRRSGASTTA